MLDCAVVKCCLVESVYIFFTPIVLSCTLQVRVGHRVLNHLSVTTPLALDWILRRVSLYTSSEKDYMHFVVSAEIASSYKRRATY